jgi:hypothetical protein
MKMLRVVNRGRFLVVGPSLLGFFLLSGCNSGGPETAVTATGEPQKVAPRFQKIEDARAKASPTTK